MWIVPQAAGGGKGEGLKTKSQLRLDHSVMGIGAADAASVWSSKSESLTSPGLLRFSRSDGGFGTKLVCSSRQ